MSKVILKYSFIFDPATAWSHLSQFESDLIEFFNAQGLDVETIGSVKGQMGERLMLLKRGDMLSKATNNNQKVQQKEAPPVKVSTIAPPKEFKQYQERGVPKSFVNQEKKQAKPIFGGLGRSNRMKIKTNG